MRSVERSRARGLGARRIPAIGSERRHRPRRRSAHRGGEVTVTATAFGQRVQAWVQATQKTLIDELEHMDGRGCFSLDEWQRPGGGGGTSAVMTDGVLFEQAGVNQSAVWGEFGDAAL